MAVKKCFYIIKLNKQNSKKTTCKTHGVFYLHAKKGVNMEKNELKEDLENKNTKEVIDNVSL